MQAQKLGWLQKVIGVCYVMIEEAERFKQTLADNFVMDDWQAVDILLGLVVAHQVPHTEMLWVKLIGASGTGKTEILRAVETLDYAAKVEHITPASLRGGYKFDRRGEPLLLERINGKLAVTKEFAVLLTARKEDRNTVFGLMRAIHDGELSSDFGSREGHLHQETKFDWIIGTTDYVERERQLEQSLGSRFIDIRWQTPGERERLAHCAVGNDVQLGRIRGELAQALRRMVDAVTPGLRPSVPHLAELADFTATFRTPLKRESKMGNEIMEVPAIESPARVAQAMSRIAAGLYALGVDNLQPYMVRIAMDTIPKTRATLIQAMLEGVAGLKELAEYCGLSQRSISYVREEMKVLGFDDAKDLSFLKPIDGEREGEWNG